MKNLIWVILLFITVSSCFSSSYPQIETILVSDTIIRYVKVNDTVYKWDTIVIYREGHSGGKAE